MNNENNKIPKIIHYVWVGRKEKSELALECIESFKTYCPEYRIIEWNEDNFDVSSNEQVRIALEEKNYAYASDIIRVWALYNYGGVYFDTDLCLTKNIDELLNYDGFLCYESKYWFGTAVIGFAPKHKVLEKIYKRYEQPTKIGFNTNPLTVHAFAAALRFYYGLKPNGKLDVINDILLLPEEYFYPINYMTLKMRKTDNTFGIHYYGSTWHNKAQKRSVNFARSSRKILGKHIYSFFEKIVANSYYRKLKKEFMRIEEQDNGTHNQS